MTRIAHRTSLPTSLFGVSVGLLGLAGAWGVGVRIWDLPPIVAHTIALLGVTTWLILLGLYARHWVRNAAAARSEFRDPVQSSFVSLVFISTMLASIASLDVSRALGTAVFGVAIVAQLVLGIWLLGRLWQGGQGADFVTPALYLPTVGQNFVAANGAAMLGWTQVGAWLFGCGAISWIVIESIVLWRAVSRAALPVRMRPAIGVQLAPPVVGGLAYLSLTSGVPDLAAQMLFGYGLLQAALLARLWPWIRQPRFTPGYWSFSFGVTALPTMGMRMMERGEAGTMARVAPLLFVGANLVIAYLAASSLRLLLEGTRASPTTDRTDAVLQDAE